jgi:hypothetical protein
MVAPCWRPTNALIEAVVMDDLQINPAFPDDFLTHEISVRANDELELTILRRPSDARRF